MRPIEFRAWDKDTKQFNYFDNDNDDYPESFWALNSSKPLMQYTGLKDKNGVKIFEGDIIKFSSSYGSSYRRKDVVEWSDGRLSWSLRHRAHLLFSTYHHEVIGNIYQHPELLE